MDTTRRIVFDMLTENPDTPLAGIARAAGVSRQRVSQICTELGFPPRRRPPREKGSDLGYPAERKCWLNMLDRCEIPASKSYAYYGGRGIKVCDRWHDFRSFLADMGPRPSPKHSLDRRDNNGDYEPRNCRWATHAEQMGNRRHKLAPKPKPPKNPVGRPPALSTEQVEAAIAWLRLRIESDGKRGKSVPQIAQRFGVSVVTLRHAVLGATGGEKLWVVGPQAGKRRKRKRFAWTEIDN